MKIIGWAAAGLLWLIDGLRQTAKHDPLWREHHAPDGQPGGALWARN